MITGVRAVLGGAGVAAICFGLWQALDFDPTQLVSAGLWLAGVIVLHDFVLSPVLVALGLAAGRVVPGHWRTPLVVAFVAWGAVTLIALPAMTGLGVRPDNPSLLDRPYVATWWAGTALAALCVLAYGLVVRRRGVR